MREILFRGKQASNGKWVYGGALPHDVDSCTIFNQHHETGRLDGYEVRPETVGQYIGLNDIHDRKIFEGDIVSAWRTDSDKRLQYAVMFETGLFGFWLFNEYNKPTGNLVIWDSETQMEIVGNIFDNPEFLTKN